MGMGPRDSPAARESAESWCRAPGSGDPHPESTRSVHGSVKLSQSVRSDPTATFAVRSGVRAVGRSAPARVGRVDAGRGGGARAAGHNASEQANTYHLIT